MSVTPKIRSLLSEYSLKDLHAGVLEVMKEEYSFLKGFFEPVVGGAGGVVAQAAPSVQQPVEAAAPAAQPQPQQALEEISTGLPKIRSDTKIRIVKKASEAQAEPEPSNTVPSNPVPTAAEPAPKEMYDPKDLKKWQKGQEQAKHAQLLATGIQPESLLTLESMKKWIQEEGRTYAYVAREYVGLPEAVVAAFAKNHSIKSAITKKRAILASKKPRS